MITMLFSEKIKCLMRRNGITQRELADKIGVNQPTVSRWFNDQMPYSKAIKLLSSEFKIPAEFFFNDNLTEEEFILKLNQFYTKKTVNDVSQKGASDKADIRVNLLNNLSPTFIRQVLQFGKTTKRARIVQIAKELALLRIELESESLLTSKK